MLAFRRLLAGIPFLLSTVIMADPAFTLLLQRHRESLLAKASSPGVQPTHRRWLAELGEDGSWRDLRYDDTSRGGWQPYHHWTRLRDLAVASQRGQAPEGTDEAMRRALAWWLRVLPQSPNWWHNDIGVPLAAADFLAMVPDRIDPEARDGCLRLLRAALSQKQTGQNLMWRCQAGILLAAMTEDADLLAELAARVAGEIRVTDGEGIQADGSFHQHGAQFYSGGYGLAFTQDAVHLTHLLHGTPWALGPGREEILRRFLLEGQRWLWMRGGFHPSSQGREIARKLSEVSAKGRLPMLRAARILADLGGDGPDRQALRDMADRLERDPGPAPLVLGFKVFGRSDFAVDHREAFSASVKWLSVRTQPTEAGNGENLFGYSLCHGLMLWMRHGKEYEAIFPVWDWHRLPGVTAARAETLPLRSWNSDPSPIVLAGGLSDGREGLAAMDFVDHPPPGTLRARKAWFFTAEGTVALGNGVEGGGGLPVWTAVEQSHGRGPVWAEGQAEPLQGRQTLRTRWIHHDQRLYLFPDAVEVTAGTVEQSGSWRRINNTYAEEALEAPVFSLWFDHGPDPLGATYAYAILPVDRPEEAAAHAEAFPWKVVANDGKSQAIQHRASGKVLAVSYPDGERAGEESPGLVIEDGQGGRLFRSLREP